MLLNSENLKNIAYKTKKISLKKADAEIYVALLSSELVKKLRDSKVEDENSKEAENFGYEIIKACVVDAKGEPVFLSDEDIDSLPPAIQSEIIDAVTDYNALSKDSQGQLEKN